MSEALNRGKAPGLSLTAAALTVGLGLLFMMVAAPAAHLYLRPQTISLNDAAQTIQNLDERGPTYLAAITLLFAVYILDIVVAWGLYWYLRPRQRALAQLVAFSRLVYAALAFVGLWAGLVAYELVANAPVAEQLGGGLEGAVLAKLTEAGAMDTFALTLFGVHLLFLAIAIWRSPHIPAWLSLPVAAAGAAYLFMYVARYFAPDLDAAWVLLFGIGELVFMAWLLAAGWRSIVAKRAEAAD